MQPPSSSYTFLSLTPLLAFAGIFIVSLFAFPTPISPLFACLLAIMYGMFTFSRDIPFNKRIEVFLHGGAHTTIIAMLYIFIFSAALTYTLKLIGGIDAAVKLGMYVLPTQYLLPGLFAVISFFATAIGSSMGAIAAFLPIGLGIAQKVGIDSTLMSGLVVSGAMLGDNLSIISDTTIAATQTTGTNMTDKFKANIKLVIPAFLMAIALFAWSNQQLTHISLEIQPISYLDFLLVSPYALVIGLALCGIDVIAVLVIGLFAALKLGIFLGSFSFLESTHFILRSFSTDTGIQEVLILALLISGLSSIVQFNGGIEYLLEQFDRKVTGKAQAEFSISLLVFLVNAAVAINTVAILITGPLAKKIGDKYHIAPPRVASLLDVVACICQGILPYAPQLLLAASLAHVSAVSIMPYLYYQWAILATVIVSIASQAFKKTNT